MNRRCQCKDEQHEDRASGKWVLGDGNRREMKEDEGDSSLKAFKDQNDVVLSRFIDVRSDPFNRAVSLL